MTVTRSRRHIRAPRPAVYAALLDPAAIVEWKVPSDMKCEVHAFEARVGGSFRISLTDESSGGMGKTSSNTDTYHGRFVELVPNERVVEVDEFETDNPELRGAMTISITLADAEDGTELVAVHEGLPSGVAASDNEIGWEMALARLAALVER